MLRFLYMNRLFPPQLIKISLFSLLLSALPVAARGDSDEISSDQDTHYSAIIKIDSEDAIESLQNEGATILRRRGNLLLCFIPRKNEAVSTRGNSELRGIEKIEYGKKTLRAMDKAREWFNADYIHSGLGLPLPYTGKGVVTGICDIGLDPLHIAFLDDTGEPRIKRVVQYKEGSGERIVLESKEDYAAWKTDNTDNWHATHVANIMAGSYGQYHGMAPGSDMVITTSQLSDVGLLCGAEDILEYAQQNGKRAVINMSMANYMGPHDGSSLFCQYLDMIGEEAVVVLSAGNGGRKIFTLPFDFTESSASAALAIYSTDWVQFDPYGAVDVWSRDSSPLKVRFGIRNAQDNEILKFFPWQELSDNNSFIVTSDPNRQATAENETIVYDEDFAGIYSGWFSLTGGIDSENGRYRAIMEYDAHTDIVSSQGQWAKYVPVIEVAGAPGSHADIYADFQFSVFRSYPGSAQPSSLLSFSDLATGENVISVGMYVNRNRRPSISGEDYTDNQQPGTIYEGSSYSTLIDGRKMPITVAPGFGIVSAMSGPFNDAHPDANEQINAEAIIDGKRYLWGTISGTSMSAPYVAGALACWLEALPEISTKDVMNYVVDSNRHDYPDPENPRHGQGWFDPLQGLKMAMVAAGINHPSNSDASNTADLRRFSFSDSHLSFWNPEAKESIITIADGSGQAQLSFTSSDNFMDIPLSTLSPGFYIAFIPGSNISLKFIVK